MKLFNLPLRLLLGLAATLSLHFSAQAQIAFTQPRQVKVDRGPLMVVLGDVDKDGDLDMVTANYQYFAHSISVTLNRGDGTFAPAKNIGVVDRPTAVVLGDVDKDGDLDIAATVNAGFNADYMIVLKNKGNGTFANRTASCADKPRNCVKIGYGAVSIKAGDMDQDGDLDLVTANYTSAVVSVLKNKGTGSFNKPQTFGVDGAFDLTLGDIDKDGDLDVVTANVGQNNVSFFKNNGSGTLTLASRLAVGASPAAVEVADVDGDTDLDIVTANQGFGGGVSILKNQGKGSFNPVQNVAVADGPWDIQLGDLDGDGDLDIATASRFTDFARFLTNDGRGNFTLQGGTGAFVGYYSTFSIALGDLDQDGDLDLAAAMYTYFDSYVAVLKNITP